MNKKNSKSKLCSRNLIIKMSIWVVPLVRYSRRFSKWTREELQHMDRSTKKLMVRHKYLPPKRWHRYVKEINEEKGLTSIEGSVDASIRGLKDCIIKHERRRITATRNSTCNVKIKRITITRKQKWEEKH